VYTAAIASSNEVVPVVDGNVSVLSRYFDVETDIVGFCQFAALAFELMPKDNPATFRRLWSSVLCT
jgi:A/G-specific adenine glycosylase